MHSSQRKMKTCKTCKHWERWTYEGREHYGECLSPKTNPEVDSRDKNFIYATDGGAYSPIITGEEFGCINHEEK